MIAVGVIRPDLAHNENARVRHEVMIGNTAKSDGAELVQIIEYVPGSAESLQAMLTTIKESGADVVYAPFRAHVADAEALILRFARLDLILDGRAWPREISA